MSIPPGILCKREDCEVERMMRALEAYRAERIAAGNRKPQSVNDYAMSCSMCGRTPKWSRSAEGLIKVLTGA